MSEGIRWWAGEAEPRAALERALLHAASPAELRVLREKPGRRRLLRVPAPGGGAYFVKHVYGRRRGHALRVRLNRALRLDAAHREWRALVRLARAGVPVPTPRALGVLPDGGTLLVLDFLEGQPLFEALAAAAGSRNALLEAVGRAVAALHAAGWMHGDLHAGNVLMTERGPVLTDLQAALPSRAGSARRRDLGELDNSLWAVLSLAQRVRLRARALGLERPFDPAAGRRLRAVGKASRARGRARASSRMRRALRSGRRFERFRFEAARGMRLSEIDSAALGEAIRAQRAGAGAALLVREFPAGRLHGLADLVRGTPARRAWQAGFGLEAHHIASARPLAFLERRRLGVPVASLLVLEPHAAAPAQTQDAATLADALARFALRLHGRGVDCSRLELRNLWLDRRQGRSEARLADLRHVRFPRRLADRRRLRALARLEASLPQAVGPAERRRAFRRYVALAPFGMPAEEALRFISRERR